MRRVKREDVPGVEPPKPKKCQLPRNRLEYSIGGLVFGGVLGFFIGGALFSSSNPLWQSSPLDAALIGTLIGMSIGLICGRLMKGSNLDKWAHFVELAKLNPEDDEINLQAGLWGYEASGSTEMNAKTEHYLKRVLKNNPNHRDAIITLAQVLTSQDKMHQVAELLEPWLENHTDYHGEELIAAALSEIGDRDKGIIHFKRLMNLQKRLRKKV